MKRTLAVLAVLVALAIGAHAQQVTLSAPVPRASEHNLRVEMFQVSRNDGANATWFVQVSVRDSAGNEIRRAGFSGPDTEHPTATVPAFLTAVDTVSAGEPAGIGGKVNWRILGFLRDHGYVAGTLE